MVIEWMGYRVGRVAGIACYRWRAAGLRRRSAGSSVFGGVVGGSQRGGFGAGAHSELAEYAADMVFDGLG